MGLPVDRWRIEGRELIGGWWYRGRAYLEVCPGLWWGNCNEAQAVLNKLGHGRNQFVMQLEQWLAAADPGMYGARDGRGIAIVAAVFEHGRESWSLLVVGDAMADSLGEWVPGNRPYHVLVPEAAMKKLWDFVVAEGEGT